MIMITPEQQIAETDELFASVKQSISDLRREMESLKEQAEFGGEINSTAVVKCAQSLSDAIGRCQKVETLLHERGNKQAGIARGGFALDLDCARAEIGCKLDRLRRCCGADQVPE